MKFEKSSRLERAIISMETIAKYFNTTMQAQRLSLLTNAVYIILMLLFGFGMVVITTSQGGLGAVFGVDQNAVTRQFACTSPVVNDTMTTYAEAKTFVELYKGECIVFHKRVGNDNGKN